MSFSHGHTENQAKQHTQQEQQTVQQANRLLFNPAQRDDSHEAHVPNDLSSALLGSTKLQAYLMADYLDHSEENDQNQIEGLLDMDTLAQLKDFANNYDDIVIAS